MGDEYEDLNTAQISAVERAKAAARVAPGRHTVQATDGSGEAYAYRADYHRVDRINWGFRVKRRGGASERQQRDL